MCTWNQVRRLFISAVVVFLGACSSRPVIMEGKDVKVSRDQAHESCKDLGVIQGKVIGTKSNVEMAIEDMKKEAAAKGANYVQMETSSAYGTSVRGTAYVCP